MAAWTPRNPHFIVGFCTVDAESAPKSHHVSHVQYNQYVSEITRGSLEAYSSRTVSTESARGFRRTDGATRGKTMCHSELLTAGLLESPEEPNERAQSAFR